MSITLELPRELEVELADEAAQLGLPLDQYALRLLAAVHLPADAPKSGAALVDYWEKQGIIGSRPEITDSQKHAGQIRRPRNLYKDGS